MHKQDGISERLNDYIVAIEKMRHGNYDNLALPDIDDPELARLREAVISLSQSLKQQQATTELLDQVTTHINSGLLLSEILEIIYDNFKHFIPYNRIGLALVDNDTVTAQWAKSDQSKLKISRGYSAKLTGSSLESIMETGEPRIINDLVAYLEKKPSSKSTRDVVAEGMRASLTCPLRFGGKHIGFIFFSSIHKHEYSNVHIEIFKQIASKVSVVVERGRLVSELSSANDELRRINDLKNAFVGMAAHDLRNPIATINTAVNLLIEPDLDMSDGERERIYDDMLQQTDHVLNLLSELLDVTEIESGKLELDLQPMNLGAFLRTAVERHNRLAAPKKTTIELDSPSELMVPADHNRLRQVVDNLISNAIKYSPQSSQIHIHVKTRKRDIEISVIDQGPGITREDRQNLFQHFARLSAKPTGGEKSTGLGLAISRRIVEAHGGKIGVDSKHRQGSRFWFTLPFT